MASRSLLLITLLGLGCEHAAATGTSPAPTAAGRAGAVAPVPSRPRSDHLLLTGARIPGRGLVDVEARDGRIARILPAGTGAEGERIELGGRTLVPGLIDSHVHLAFRFGEDRDHGARHLAATGLAAVVDLAAPIETLGIELPPLRLVASGPMITAPGGYPTRSWGAGGYGRPGEGIAELRRSVDALHEAGARVIKVAMQGPPSLSDEELRAVVERAHELELPVVAHALEDAEARRAGLVGIDVLAHVPLEPLHDATVRAWSGRSVISTLGAFGGSSIAVDNLRRLRAAGATVLYGTDLGNPGVLATGISEEELELLVEAGLDGPAILEAATVAPAARWGLPSLGALEEGRAATFLVLDEDPWLEPTALAHPVAVYVDGILQSPA
ncbi:MAG: amidohydrolase family protein [Myxococcales bacterium]|nr:amidohydrolase family protein [Myxococcales bacterium]MCB9713289.1 amidohydrolase family protein [Myxococcales bacterium]